MITCMFSVSKKGLRAGVGFLFSKPGGQVQAKNIMISIFYTTLQHLTAFDSWIRKSRHSILSFYGRHLVSEDEEGVKGGFCWCLRASGRHHRDLWRHNRGEDRICSAAARLCCRFRFEPEWIVRIRHYTHTGYL